MCDLQENTFYALIYLTLRGETVAIDARPSDAIALALRTRAPIFVEETVIDHAKTVDFSADRADADGSRSGSRAWIPTISASTRCDPRREGGAVRPGRLTASRSVPRMAPVLHLSDSRYNRPT